MNRERGMCLGAPSQAPVLEKLVGCFCEIHCFRFFTFLLLLRADDNEYTDSTQDTHFVMTQHQKPNHPPPVPLVLLQLPKQSGTVPVK